VANSSFTPLMASMQSDSNSLVFIRKRNLLSSFFVLKKKRFNKLLLHFSSALLRQIQCTVKQTPTASFCEKQLISSTCPHSFWSSITLVFLKVGYLPLIIGTPSKSHGYSGQKAMMDKVLCVGRTVTVDWSLVSSIPDDDNATETELT